MHRVHPTTRPVPVRGHRTTSIYATASPLQRRVPRDNTKTTSQTTPLINAATTTFEPWVTQRTHEQEECCVADLWDAGLCEGALKRCDSGLPPEVERLAGGFTDAPEVCKPPKGLLSWWRYQGL